MKKSRNHQSSCSHEQLSHSRRQFLIGALAAGAVGFTACDPPQTVQVNSTATPTPSATPTPAAMPSMPPLPAKTYPADAKNAMIAIDEMVNHYAKVFDSPSALIHAVRAFGKNFKRADGSSTVEHLCSRYAEENTVNGKRLIRFTRFNVEVHDNSFLKTFLEAGVSMDQPVTIGGSKFSLRDVAEHAKAQFRLDPGNLARYEKDYTHEHLPWTLIAFSTLMPGGKGAWENAYGEKIDLMEVIDKSLAEFEATCQPVKPAMESNSALSKPLHEAIKTYSCYGGHSLYGFLACIKNGYTERGLKARMDEMMKLSLYRLVKEVENIEAEYDERRSGPLSPNAQENAAYLKQFEQLGIRQEDLVDMLKWRGVFKLTGHLLEAVNFARLHKLFQPAPEQQKLIQGGEQKLFESVVKLRALNLEGLRSFNAKEFNDNVIALGHASRAMKLLTPNNPDQNPKTI
jgi:hypothetical protein